MTTARILVAAAVLSVSAGCAQRTDAGLLEQAEYFILEQRYAEAIPLLKQLLLSNPNHSGAHYYLGRCYFAPKDTFWFTIAEGEIQTALNLFIREGRKSTIPRFPDAYFELICHLDIAKIRLRQAMFLVEQDAPLSAVSELLAQAADSVEEARKVAPDSPDVTQIDQTLTQFRRTIQGVPAGPPPVPRRII